MYKFSFACLLLIEAGLMLSSSPALALNPIRMTKDRPSNGCCLAPQQGADGNWDYTLVCPCPGASVPVMVNPLNSQSKIIGGSVSQESLDAIIIQPVK